MQKNVIKVVISKIIMYVEMHTCTTKQSEKQLDTPCSFKNSQGGGEFAQHTLLGTTKKIKSGPGRPAAAAVGDCVA